MEPGAGGHILILAYAYPPENIAGAKRPFRFARYLPQFGYQVSVVTASEQAPGAGGVRHIPDRLPVWAKAVRKFIAPGELGLAWMVPAIRAGSEIVRLRGANAVFSTSPPAPSHAVALWLKRRHGLRWIADFRDPIAGNPIRRHKALPLVDGCLEPLIFRYADAVIANTDAVAELWRRRYPRWREKIQVIWNGFDPNDPLGPAAIPQRGYRILAHAGSIPCGRYPWPLTAALERLQARGLVTAAILRVQLVGWLDEAAIERPEQMRALCHSGLLELIPPLPAAAAARMMCEADFNLLLDMIGPHAGLQVPSKIYEYVRVGRPVLAVTTRNSPVDRILARSGVRYASLYPDDAPEETDRRLLAFLSFSSEPAKPSAWFEETFNALCQTRTLARLLA